MKRKHILTILSLSLLTLFSCSKDNYDEPESELTGTIVFNGQAIGLRQTDEAVQMQLWQDGYELYTAIPIYVTQEGTFSAKLFNGTYKLVSRDKNGPWINSRDTVIVTVSGRTNIEYPVKPYYTISDEKYQIVGDSLIATFNVNKANGDETIEYVRLFINKTKFVDIGTNVRSVDAQQKTTGSNRIAMKISDRSDKYLFARIGVKTSGIDHLIYTAGSEQVK
ncbi:MAG: DUF3823 domain-containing protein [Dysgonomonas sp.]|nr:DUF3823 domain-containing protein [Dysgonomonas sp.]